MNEFIDGFVGGTFNGKDLLAIIIVAAIVLWPRRRR